MDVSKFIIIVDCRKWKICDIWSWMYLEFREEITGFIVQSKPRWIQFLQLCIPPKNIKVYEFMPKKTNQFINIIVILWLQVGYSSWMVWWKYVFKDGNLTGACMWIVLILWLLYLLLPLMWLPFSMMMCATGKKHSWCTIEPIQPSRFSSASEFSSLQTIYLTFYEKFWVASRLESPLFVCGEW